MAATQFADDYVNHWYEVVEDGTLRQGDIFRNLLVFWADDSIEPTDTEPVPDGHGRLSYARGDFIVASASCDVGQPSYPYALLSRIVEASEEQLKVKGKDYQTRVEVLRQGLVPSQFLLAPCHFVDPAFPLSIVQHKVHTLLPVSYLQRCCTGSRLRLRHPIREKFGAWVGASFSRVGPEDASQIPQGTKIYPAHVLAANETTD